MSWAHDMSAVSPSGHTLYYNIINGHAEVVRPSGSFTAYVSGDVVIPQYVVYQGTSYPVTKIGDNAFQGCYTSLRSVVIPNTVTTIGQEAFFQCQNLQSVTFGNSVDTIGWCAFIYCFSLSSITLPASVSYIESSAFAHCNSVASITLRSEVPPFVGITPFQEIPVHIPIYVPCGSDSAYRAANGWSNFINYHEFRYILSATSANDRFGSVQIITAPSCENDTAVIQASPSNGFHFVNWSDGITSPRRTIVLNQDTNLVAYFEVDDCDPITSFPWNNNFQENLLCWKTVDADGDGYNWGYKDGYAYSESYSYFDGSNNELSPDNWLISRRIRIPSGDNYNYDLSWVAQAAGVNRFNEHYSVYVSGGGNDPNDFTQLFTETTTSHDVVRHSVSLNNYRGLVIRIAFRHHNTNNGVYLALAQVKITKTTPPPPQGIEDVENNNIGIYASNGQIVLEGDITDLVKVYDIKGRYIVGGRDNKFTVPTSGVYIVRIGSNTVRKVIVIK